MSLLGHSPVGLSLRVALGSSGQEGGMPNSKEHSEVAKGKGKCHEWSPMAVRDIYSRPGDS